MFMTPARRIAAVALAAGLLVTACSSDDGADTRDDGSASATGISAEDVAGTSDNPLIIEAVDGYQAYVEEQVTALVDDTMVFTDAVREGDIEAAKAAYPTSRIRWERIEPIAGLIGDTDAAVDSRAEDGVPDTDSPEVTGWHQLEYNLWVAEDISTSSDLADGLDEELAKLRDGVADLKITPLAVAKGASELIEEVADGKITGEEDRYSHTDLWDLNANVEGAQAATELLLPAIEESDPDLAQQITDDFTAANEALAPYRDGEGWTSYDEVTESDRIALKAKFSALAESLAEVPGALKLS